MLRFDSSLASEASSSRGGLSSDKASSEVLATSQGRPISPWVGSSWILPGYYHFHATRADLLRRLDENRVPGSL